MDQERPKRRKCGPRVKTGCITCRIRRVKCDEDKPNCQRCVSTGRKCDGYVAQAKSNGRRSNGSADTAMELAIRPGLPTSPSLNAVDTQQERQLFQFYCVKSAVDLSVYLNSGFWHDMILQYSQHNEVVRRAVLAFGSSHMYALSVYRQKGGSEASLSDIEQARQYDLALRSLREYMTHESRPDPHVILICCALFFSCENARGNREAAWQHLENGLHIVKSVEGQKVKKLPKNENEVTSELELVAFRNGSKLKAKTDKTDVDEELIYVFSRLDVQATLCKQSRQPVLNLGELSEPAISDPSNATTTFVNITDAQRSLDYIHNRLARFLSSAAKSQTQDTSPSTPEPDWIENERLQLNKLCASWESCMYSFVNEQIPAVKQNLQSQHAPNPSNNPEWQMAVQIQLLTLHHRCWWMLFRSYHNPSAFTMSPNHRATEILDVCEFLGFALPVRPSAMFNMTETDIAWKMISEIGVTAPLFVLATKCTDANIKSRAIQQLTALKDHGNGMYHETFLDQVIKRAKHSAEALHHRDSVATLESFADTETLGGRASPLVATPGSEQDFASDGSTYTSLEPYDEGGESVCDSGGLLGWSKTSIGVRGTESR